MERFWNIIHYFLYKAFCKLFMGFSKIDPFDLLIRQIYRIPAVKRFSEKRGATLKVIDDGLDKVFKNPSYGLSSMFAGIYITFFPTIFLIGLDIIISVLTNTLSPEYAKASYIRSIIFGVILYFISYIFIFRHDKYLKYFKEFDRKPKQWHVKYGRISLAVCLIPFAVLILSFVLASK